MNRYKCGRCEQTFDKIGYLRQHTMKNKIPCDLICNICEVKYQTKRLYKDHITKECKNNLDNLKDMSSEYQLDRFSVHCIVDTSPFRKTCYTEKLEEMLSFYMRAPNQNWKTFKSLIYDMVKLFFCNHEHPETHILIAQDVLIDNYKTETIIMVYDGSKFVPDFFVNKMRYQWILHFILRFFEYFAKEQLCLAKQRMVDYIEKYIEPFVIGLAHNLLYDNLYHKIILLLKENATRLNAINYVRYPKSTESALSELDKQKELESFKEWENIIHQRYLTIRDKKLEMEIYETDFRNRRIAF